MKLFLITIAVICFLVAISEQAPLIAGLDKSLVLGNGETPPYQILETLAENVELRKYYGAIYAASREFSANASARSEKDWSMNLAERNAKIGFYFAGYNNASLVMPMTGLTSVTWAKAYANGSAALGEELNSFNTPLYSEVWWYVSPAYSKHIPQPNDRTVIVFSFEDYDTVSIRFGGYPSAADLLAYRQALIDAAGGQENVDKLGEPSGFTVISYDPWWKFWNRRNEMHLYQKGYPTPNVIYGPQ